MQSSSSIKNSSSKSISQPFDHSFKILLIGNSGVGKSSVLMQFSDQKFVANYFTTIGVDYKIKYLKVRDLNIKLQIWDTAGQDRFKTITSSYYRGAQGIIIVYDITDRSSFQSVTHWLQQIDKLTDQKTKKYLIGNKVDLQQKRQVSFIQGKQLAAKINIPFKQTSARSATGVAQIFQELAEIILGYDNNSDLIKPAISIPSKNQSQPIKKLTVQKPQKKDQGCC